jgi:Ala-tRNA(Pro) deacylase
MRVIEYLDKSGVKYELRAHKPVFTAQRIAAEEHEPGKFVAKPVIVKADEKFLMCVLAACYMIDLRNLKQTLGVKKLELITEDEMARLFDDCEPGAEPPFGNLYNISTIMDKALEKDDHIVFQAGTHDKAIKMSLADYKRLVSPSVMEFSYHTT